jgi:hypothetical protein
VSLRRGSRALHVVLAGGLAERKGFTEADADPWELRRGEKHELEHTSERSLARQIALDHLAEDPRYYSRLKSCETMTSKAERAKRSVAIDSTLKERVARALGKKS